MKKEFYYHSLDKITDIHAVEWLPDGEPIAILQIAHGMVEFIERYALFAEFMASQGIYVVGNDHLGHGLSVESDSSYGYFAKDNGNDIVLGDMEQLRQITSDRYKGVPYFLLGHSMGSFLTRQYVERHGAKLSGAIIMGTGVQPNLILDAAMMICKLIAKSKGWNYRSKFIDNLAVGSNNKRFQPARTTRDWLTKDNAVVDAYLANPLDTFLFTVNGYYNMFYSIKDAANKQNINRIPKDLPLLIVSGKDDPVGGFGSGVIKVKESFVRAGIINVQAKLYAGDRHEILNELDKEKVYSDILDWILLAAAKSLKESEL